MTGSNITIRTGLLGRSLSHSCSPQIHALYGDPGYRLFEVEPDGVRDFLINGPYDALNVTIPYKKLVAGFCDELSEGAAALGAVNVVTRLPGGGLRGDNADIFGFAYAFAAGGVSAKGKKTLLLGDGGAAATVRHVLESLGSEVVTVSRRGPVAFADVHSHGDARIIVNATPVGMYPHASGTPCPLDGFGNLEYVFDLVYNPRRTVLLKEAGSLGIPCQDGLLMLVAQAHRSREIFTGQKIGHEAIDRVFRAIAAGMAS